MQSSVTESLWKEILGDFRNTLSRDIYENWFDSIHAVTDEIGTLELRASNEFSRIWLEDNYLDLIREKANNLAGEEVMVRITTGES